MRKLLALAVMASILVLSSSCQKKGRCYNPTFGIYGPTVSGSGYEAAKDDCLSKGDVWQDQ